MGADVVIRAENLGKQYRIGRRVEGARYTALRDVISEGVRATGRNVGRLWRGGVVAKSPRAEHFWALRDVNFKVRRGEVVGIIGRNGAGKSTLLKMLSRITEPTEGRVVVRGRIASLLEVGTGFHPELTGRENIYLNGAILGMTRAEIRRKFDEIVAFAEVERFLDTPVKRYSSGMYVRLAFSVAAHLEPEILVVDEVLAVGDAEFQKKCLGKMQDVAGHGRTVLFVSHNMAAVQNLCSRAILLANGKQVADAIVTEIVAQYFEVNRAAATASLEGRSDRQGSGELRFVSVTAADKAGRPLQTLQCGRDIVLLVEVENMTAQALRGAVLSFGIDNAHGQRIAELDTEVVGIDMPPLPVGRSTVSISVPKLPLMPGSYQLSAFASQSGQIVDWVQNATIIQVDEGDYYGSGRLHPVGKALFLIDHSFASRPSFPRLNAGET
jgi:lipopolysaccharide transport system ATP-binding protein